ncbi:ROK family transcriptional regulator [Nesterenkonia alba]|uniref:ROK family transcriptional regulator n=1 Tax=Nesterenkonia alba TaxID=515814 RepID=UPI0003B3BAEA|nr:ROK family transcriptional regulator [Nesterenkonia alba]
MTHTTLDFYGADGRPTGPSQLARLGRRSVTSSLIPHHGNGESKHDFARPQRRDRPPRHEAQRPGARQESLREANLLLLTEEIFASAEPLSRADLSIRTGMTRSTVSRLVDDLLAAGIIREGSPMVGGARGRPAVPLSPARRTLVGLGLEVNVDFMAARALDLTGEVLAERIVDGDYRDSAPELVLAEAVRLAGEVTAEVTGAGARLVGTVLALPGLIAADARTVLFAPNLRWRGVDVVGILRACADRADSFGGFITVVNEAKLAALAVAQELTSADGREQTFLYISAQMGIGSAVVVDGVVETGAHGWAGELGHISVEPSGPECRCGSSGCLEVYAGKHSILQAAGLQPGAEGSRQLSELIALTEWDNPAGGQAVEAIERAGWALGVALSVAMNIVDVHDVVLGGEFAPLTDLLRPRIEDQLQRRVLSADFAHFRVRESATGLAPATTGGALRALRAVVDAPQDWVPAEA